MWPNKVATQWLDLKLPYFCKKTIFVLFVDFDSIWFSGEPSLPVAETVRLWKCFGLGGYEDDLLKTVERYNPETNTWTKRADLNTARYCPGACVINGKIYIVGGWVVWVWRNVKITSVSNNMRMCVHDWS